MEVSLALLAPADTDEGQLPDMAASRQVSFTLILCSCNLHEPVTSASKHPADTLLSVSTDLQPKVLCDWLTQFT